MLSLVPKIDSLGPSGGHVLTKTGEQGLESKLSKRSSLPLFLSPCLSLSYHSRGEQRSVVGEISQRAKIAATGISLAACSRADLHCLVMGSSRKPLYIAQCIFFFFLRILICISYLSLVYCSRLENNAGFVRGLNKFL